MFEREAKQTGRQRLLLTMAAAGGSHFINVAYEPHKIIQYAHMPRLYHTISPGNMYPG